MSCQSFLDWSVEDVFYFSIFCIAFCQLALCLQSSRWWSLITETILSFITSEICLCACPSLRELSKILVSNPFISSPSNFLYSIKEHYLPTDPSFTAPPDRPSFIKLSPYFASIAALSLKKFISAWSVFFPFDAFYSIIFNGVFLIARRPTHNNFEISFREGSHNNVNEWKIHGRMNQWERRFYSCPVFWNSYWRIEINKFLRSGSIFTKVLSDRFIRTSKCSLMVHIQKRRWIF